MPLFLNFESVVNHGLNFGHHCFLRAARFHLLHALNLAQGVASDFTQAPYQRDSSHAGWKKRGERLLTEARAGEVDLKSDKITKARQASAFVFINVE